MASVNERHRIELLELLDRPLAAEGAEIAELVLSTYKKSTTIRIYLYSQHGATLDECSRLSRIIGDLIDGTEWFENGYTLEVSSPGLDRPLTHARDFKHRTGELVRIEFVDDARKKLTAEILSATDTEVELQAGDDVIRIPLSEIKRAKIVF